MTEKTDTSGWLRKPEVADKIEKSLAAVTRYTEKGKLHPVTVEGINYYDPAEVAALAEEIAKEREQLTRLPESRKDTIDAYVVDTLRSIVGLVKDPREKIDAIQFSIIRDLRERVADLEKKLDESKAAVEAAKDQTLERNLAVKQVESEHRIKELAMGRMVETVGKLITGFGKEGVALTPEQLEQLLTANDDGGEKFLTPEQEKQAREIVAKGKAKTNGKAVVQTVADKVKAASGTVVNNDQG